MRKKRGQISFYIVIGIIILIGLGLILFISAEEKKKPLAITKEALVPKEVLPLKTFVQDCIEGIAQDGIIRLGQQGGYLYYPEYIENDKNSFISIDPLGIVKLPFWHFQGRPRMPQLIDMEEDLSRYINENLPACTNGFEAFENQFAVGEPEPISTLVSIANQFVVINVRYPLVIKDHQRGSETIVNTFNAKVPVKLKRMYEYAQDIMRTENTQLFFENITLDLMAMNPDIPFTGLEFQCSQKVWHLDDVKQQLSTTLQQMLPRTRFKDSSYEPFLAPMTQYEQLAQFTLEDINDGKRPGFPAPPDSYEYFHLFIDASPSDYKDLRASVVYQPEWGMEIYANPNDNGRLVPDMGKGHKRFLRNLCFQFYHFTYDVRFPVQVALSDEQSLNAQGYVFRFATPVQIIHNRPDRRDAGVSIFRSYKSNSNLCDSNGPAVDIRVKGMLDGFFNMDIPDAKVTYDCLKYSCELGMTHADEGIYRLRTNLPSGCANGFYEIEKEGYLTARTQQLEPQQDIDLKKLAPVGVSVLKHPKDTLAVEKPLDSWDSVVIHLRDAKNDYDIYNEFLPDQPIAIDLIDEDTVYEADILLFDNLDNTIYGGYKGNLSITHDDLKNNNHITLHVVEWLPKPFTTDDTVALVQYLEEDTSYWEPLEPTLSLEVTD